MGRTWMHHRPGIADERAFDTAIGGKPCTSSADRAIAKLAAGQHGVVGRSQLIDLGVGRRAIEHRLEKGRLHTVHRGVYAVGHQALAREARWMAAVLVAGRGAVLSHRSAAALWGIRASARLPEVTTPRRIRPLRGIQPHRRRLPPDEVTALRGIPVTTVPRTLLDLAAVLGRRQVERAVHEAEARRLTDPLSLADLVNRYPGRRGIAAIKAILAAGALGSTVTRSELEERFLGFLEDAGLPRAEVNARLQAGDLWFEVDCIWRAQRLIVELDGHAFHASPAAYERDRARDRGLHAAGWRVVRVTWRQLHGESEGLATDLRELLEVDASRSSLGSNR